jgi:predicted RNA binding protein YcfA (HicA-like mRNA interferase family)
MKCRDLIRHLEAHGCRFDRDDGKHTVYMNPATRRTASIPRHREINNLTARGICRQLGIPAP